MAFQAAAAEQPLDPVAREFVKLSLEAGEREPGYVDAYYGPKEWAEAAKVNTRSVPELIAAAKNLRARAEAIPATGIEARRKASLIGQLHAAETRLAMLQGQKFAFAEEAQGLFGVTPQLKPLTHYDPILTEIDALVPGPGPLWERVSSYRGRFRVPADKLRPVMDAAIAECRRRTAAHIPLPSNEHFSLAFVTGKPWDAYNYYLGDGNSRIEVNTDLPVLIDSVVNWGCHEGYPGHHVLNLLVEQKLVGERGWQEFSVYPLYSPESLLAEGSATYAARLAFPGEERAEFEAKILYPLAGLDPGEAAKNSQLRQAIGKLATSSVTITGDYIDGRISREQAIALIQKYGLTDRTRAEKAVSAMDYYRSYIINYGYGRDLVQSTVEAAGTDPDARWAMMTKLLSEPTLPSDLKLPAH